MKKREIDAFQFDDSIGYIIGRTAKVLSDKFQRTLKAQGLKITTAHWALLNRLWEEDGLSQVELAERAYKYKPNVTRILDVMERNGLVRRQKDENDRRAYKIYLTDQGKTIKYEVIPIVKGMLDQATRGISKKDIDHMVKTLDKVSKNMR